MAITTQSAQLVRQKAYFSTYSYNASTTSPEQVSPLNYYVFKAFFLHMAMNKGNPDLNYTNIDGLYNSSDGGNTADQVLCNGPCTLYAIFLRKTGSTSTSFKWTNHASTATTDGTQDGVISMTVAGSCFQIFPDGRALSTGLTVTEDTTRTGSTLTLKANKIDGFVILGA